jgi:hypothetical protein
MHHPPQKQYQEPKKSPSALPASASSSRPQTASAGTGDSGLGTAVAVGVGIAAVAAAIAGIGYLIGQNDSSSKVEAESSEEESGTLLPNLVPQAAFGKKFKPYIPQGLFATLRSHYLVISNYACKFCGYTKAMDKLVLHQEWRVELNDDTAPSSGTLVFEDFEIVCWNCHDCKHSGWSLLSGRPCTAHMAKVNGWEVSETEEVIKALHSSWATHKHLTRAQWTYQDNAFWEHPVVLAYLQANPQTRQDIRFGSLCVLPGYNHHPPPRHR